MTRLASRCAGAFVILAALGPTHANGVGSPAPLVTEVHVRELAFAPDAVEVTVGDTIRWINHDIVPHTVTGDVGPDLGARPQPSRRAIDSGLLLSGQAFDFVPTMAGVVSYHCRYHPGMTGVLRVLGAGRVGR